MSINNQLITIIIKSKYYWISLAISILGVYLGAEFQIHPVMNIKRNIILHLKAAKEWRSNRG